MFFRNRQEAVLVHNRTVLLVLIVLTTLFSGSLPLKCFKCLNLECPEGDTGEKNELLCQSVRSFIVKSLYRFYEIGPTGYLGQCPERDETLQWALMQQSSETCPEIKEGATCSLGRIQVISDTSGRSITSHATIMGCLKSALLRYMKDVGKGNSCSLFKQNSTGDSIQYTHRLMLENCPKSTDYCYATNFCVPFSESVVKSFQENNGSRSFEAGIIIAIVVVILVVVIVVLLASFCKNPLSRGANYSPAQVQNTGIRSTESPDSEIPSTSKNDDDVFA